MGKGEAKDRRTKTSNIVMYVECIEGRARDRLNLNRNVFHHKIKRRTNETRDDSSAKTSRWCLVNRFVMTRAASGPNSELAVETNNKDHSGTRVSRLVGGSSPMR